MIRDRNVIVLDIDRTLAQERAPGQTYADIKPIYAVLAKLRSYRADGYYIILHTSREMSHNQGNLGRILARTAPTLFEWLAKHDVPYDEIYFGKPWPGKDGFYVDDRAIRPSEFVRHSHEEIKQLLDREQAVLREIEAEREAAG